MHIFTKKCAIMNDYLKRRNEDCLYWYFQAMKDLGDVKKAGLYAYVAYKMYISEQYAARIVCDMIKDCDAYRRAEARVV